MMTDDNRIDHVEWSMQDINVQPTKRRRGWWLLLLMSWDALVRR